MKINCLHPENIFYVISVIYVMFSTTTPYKTDKFWSNIVLMSSIMGIYIWFTYDA